MNNDFNKTYTYNLFFRLLYSWGKEGGNTKE